MEFNKSLIIRKLNKPDIRLYIIFSVVLLIYIKTRWFFTHNPLLIFSNLKPVELESIFFKNLNLSN